MKEESLAPSPGPSSGAPPAPRPGGWLSKYEGGPHELLESFCRKVEDFNWDACGGLQTKVDFLEFAILELRTVSVSSQNAREHESIDTKLVEEVPAKLKATDQPGASLKKAKAVKRPTFEVSKWREDNPLSTFNIRKLNATVTSQLSLSLPDSDVIDIVKKIVSIGSVQAMDQVKSLLEHFEHPATPSHTNLLRKLLEQEDADQYNGFISRWRHSLLAQQHADAAKDAIYAQPNISQNTASSRAWRYLVEQAWPEHVGDEVAIKTKSITAKM